METQTQSIMVHRDHWTPEHMALLCGIANAGGGTLIVESTSKVFGPARRKMRRPFEQIPKLVEKELGIDCTTEPVLDGSVLCLEIIVPAAPKPISYDGVYWLFVDDYNTRSSRQAVQAVLDGGAQTAQGAGDSWELQAQPNAKLKDLNTEAFLALATVKSESPNLASDSISDTFSTRMQDMGIATSQGSGLTNASVLLLHNEPERFIPGARIQLKLIGQEGRELLSHNINGALIRQLDETMRLLFEQYLPMAMVTAGPVDDQTLALNFPPRDAVRDALLLALAHKDYTQDTPVCVDVHSQQLVITHPINMNSGDDIGQVDADGYDAAPVGAANPLLTRALQMMGIMNEHGVHHDSIASRCASAGSSTPLFEQHQDGARAVFPLDLDEKPQAPQSAPSEAVQVAPSTEEATAQRGSNIVGLTGSVSKDAPFSARSIAAANELDLTSTDEYVLRVLHSNGRATAVRIANVLGVSESTVRRAFRKLRKHGIIERIGSDKAGYWRVNL